MSQKPTRNNYNYAVIYYKFNQNSKFNRYITDMTFLSRKHAMPFMMRTYPCGMPSISFPPQVGKEKNVNLNKKRKKKNKKKRKFEKIKF